MNDVCSNYTELSASSIPTPSFSYVVGNSAIAEKTRKPYQTRPPLRLQYFRYWVWDGYRKEFNFQGFTNFRRSSGPFMALIAVRCLKNSWKWAFRHVKVHSPEAWIKQGHFERKGGHVFLARDWESQHEIQIQLLRPIQERTIGSRRNRKRRDIDVRSSMQPMKSIPTIGNGHLEKILYQSDYTNLPSGIPLRGQDGWTEKNFSMQFLKK